MRSFGFVTEDDPGNNLREHLRFQFLKDKGYNYLVGGYHVKGQVINPVGLTEWGYGGQTCQRGDRKDGKPDPDFKKQSAAWLKQVVICTHELPGTAKHDPLAYLQNLIERGELVHILTDFSTQVTGMYAVYPPGRLVSQRVRVFSDALYAHFRERSI